MRFKCGKGTMLVCNAPIDRQTVGRTDVLTGEVIQPYYLVLREAAKIAGVKHVVEKGDCPLVGITEHPASDGKTIVMAIELRAARDRLPREDSRHARTCLARKRQIGFNRSSSERSSHV